MPHGLSPDSLAPADSSSPEPKTAGPEPARRSLKSFVASTRFLAWLLGPPRPELFQRVARARLASSRGARPRPGSDEPRGAKSCAPLASKTRVHALFWRTRFKNYLLVVPLAIPSRPRLRGRPAPFRERRNSTRRFRGDCLPFRGSVGLCIPMR
jgi:hypothetical protein